MTAVLISLKPVGRSPQNRWIACVLAAVLLPLLDGCPDSRCSEANCKLVLERCHLQVDLGQFCFQTFGYANLADTGVDFDAYCAKQCQDEGNGAVWQCLADHSQACANGYADGGETGLLVAIGHIQKICVSVDGGAGDTDAGCVNGCLLTETSCEQACPTTTSNACFDCSNVCVEARDHCWNQCP